MCLFCISFDLQRLVVYGFSQNCLNCPPGFGLFGQGWRNLRPTLQAVATPDFPIDRLHCHRVASQLEQNLFLSIALNSKRLRLHQHTQTADTDFLNTDADTE